MSRLQDEMMSFLDAKDIEKLVRRLPKEIQADYVGKEVILVCPLKGSFHFVADLTRHLDLKQQIDFVQLSGAGQFGTVRILKDISVNVAGKHVLICEEIIDTGRTLNFLKTRLLASNP